MSARHERALQCCRGGASAPRDANLSGGNAVPRLSASTGASSSADKIESGWGTLPCPSVEQGPAPSWPLRTATRASRTAATDTRTLHVPACGGTHASFALWRLWVSARSVASRAPWNCPASPPVTPPCFLWHFTRRRAVVKPIPSPITSNGLTSKRVAISMQGSSVSTVTILMEEDRKSVV